MAEQVKTAKDNQPKGLYSQQKLVLRALEPSQVLFVVPAKNNVLWACL